MEKALTSLNEGFLYNGFPHKNNLKFYGAYLAGSTFQSEYLKDTKDESDAKQDEEEEHISLGDKNLIIGGVTF